MSTKSIKILLALAVVTAMMLSALRRRRDTGPRRAGRCHRNTYRRSRCADRYICCRGYRSPGR